MYLMYGIVFEMWILLSCYRTEDKVFNDNMSCVGLPVIPNGMLQTDPQRTTPYRVNDFIRFICEPGYGSNDFRVVCTDTGWSKVSCQPKSCGPPPEYPNVLRSKGLYTFPGEIKYTCEEGYDLYKGSEKLKGYSIFCGTTGNWMLIPPKLECRRVQCPKLDAPENGRVSLTDFLFFKSVAHYECDPGFKRVGDGSRTCRGTWSGVEPTCQRMGCPPLPKDLTILNPEGYTGRSGDVMLFKCGDDETVKTIKCLGNGEWSLSPPYCPPKLMDSPSTDVVSLIGSIATLPANAASAVMAKRKPSPLLWLIVAAFVFLFLFMGYFLLRWIHN